VVVKAASGLVSERSEAAFHALAAGQWEAARAAFQAALREHEAAELLEGLSWAAWWLDDAESVFESRERAYRLYRRRGESASAARMAIWIGADHLDFNGAIAVTAGWLRRAARLLDRVEPSPEHGWLAFQQGYLAHITGDIASAARLARRAAETGRRFGVPDLEMLGLALEGGALVASAQVEEGMRCLDEAAVTALEGEATIAISAAWAFCFMVSACLDVRDYPRAIEWNDRIAQFATRYRSRYMLGFCRTYYGALHLSRGRWGDAESELIEAVDSYARSRPALVGDALVWLAELRRRQGRLEEAGRLLDRAGDMHSAYLCRGRLALDADDPLRAIELGERCLRQISKDRRLERAAALELLIRARITRREFDVAAVLVDELRAVAQAVAALPLRASVTLAEGNLAAASGDHESARRLLEDATDAFERSGAVFEALTARAALASTLLALGRGGVAEQEARRAMAGLAELGANLEATRARRVVDACAGIPVRGNGLKDITPRELEVLSFLAEGLTNRQIAVRLVLSEHTIHRHVTNILRKLELPSRTAAAAFAVREGLLDQADA
jgi:LuxR family maltose regulon positive regulatory protein